MTPSLPTFSMASEISCPIDMSLLAEIAPTWAISSFPGMGLLSCLSSSTTFATALSMPRFRWVGLLPAVTLRKPSLKIDCAKRVAVVVPSPATSLVLEATSLTIWAPMFSIGSSNSISFATVTPSLVTVGAPNFLSITTFLPFGPRVTFTASASWSSPFFKEVRASALKSMSFAAILTYLHIGLNVYSGFARL